MGVIKGRNSHPACLALSFSEPRQPLKSNFSTDDVTALRPALPECRPLRQIQRRSVSLHLTIQREVAFLLFRIFSLVRIIRFVSGNVTIVKSRCFPPEKYLPLRFFGNDCEGFLLRQKSGGCYGDTPKTSPAIAMDKQRRNRSSVAACTFCIVFGTAGGKDH